MPHQPLVDRRVVGKPLGAPRDESIMVLTLIGDQVATITGFPDPALFPLFDLSPTPRP